MHKNSSHQPSLENPIPPLGSVKRTQPRSTQAHSSSPTHSSAKHEPVLTSGEIEEIQFKQCCTALIFVVLLALLAFIAVLKMHGFSYGQV